MKTVNGYVSTNKVGSKSTFQFEVEDDCTDEEIAFYAEQAMLDKITWNYEVE